jgi:hypothetical protein
MWKAQKILDFCLCRVTLLSSYQYQMWLTMLYFSVDDQNSSSPVLSAIEKVERWRKNLPSREAGVGTTPHGGLPSCYSSLPSSPAPSQVSEICRAGRLGRA